MVPTIHRPMDTSRASSFEKTLPSKPRPGKPSSSSSSGGNAAASPSHATSRASKHDAASKSSRSSTTMTTVLIGPKQQRFKVHKKLLCAASPFFRERIEDPSHSRPISLWLPGESGSMFALFVAWLHDRANFRAYLDEAADAADEAGSQTMQEMHWAMIRLHLFASHLSIYHLQDFAMDAIQDLYLKRNWDVTPSLINYLYTKCESLPSVRLRRWAVAMVAFSLTSSSPAAADADASTPTSDTSMSPPHFVRRLQPLSGLWDESSEGSVADIDTPDPTRFDALLESLPEFSADYAIHMDKMNASGLNVRFKNPQLRIPANKLRNEERSFGFRQCSFHSHRAVVGERRCPHDRRAHASSHSAAATSSASSAVNGDSGKAPSTAISASRKLALARLDLELGKDLPGLSPPTRRPGQSEHADDPHSPLFFNPSDLDRDKAHRHMRSISSTMK